MASLTGVLLASRRLAGMLIAPAAGHVSDRLGDRRAVAQVGALVALAGYVVMVGTDWGMTTIVLGVVLNAVGEAVLHPAAERLGRRRARRRNGVAP